MELVSIIIATRNRKSDLLHLIASINSLEWKSLELILVDASDQASINDYQPYINPKIQFRYVRAQPGLTKQRNIGLLHASGPIVCFFDDDVILDPNYISNIMLEFQNPKNKHVGAVCGNITNVTSALTRGSVIFRFHRQVDKIIRHWFFIMRSGSGRFLPSGMPTFLPSSSPRVTCECLFGACMAFRKDVITKLQFDERLERYAYMEDDDVAYRTSRKYSIVFCPQATCGHFPSQKNRLADYSAAKMLIINHHYLFRKNFPKVLKNKLAHGLSLIGYPILMAWELDWLRFLGSISALWSICWRLDYLSAAELE